MNSSIESHEFTPPTFEMRRAALAERKYSRAVIVLESDLQAYLEQS
jgi:hypothetical protein